MALERARKEGAVALVAILVVAASILRVVATDGSQPDRERLEQDLYHYRQMTKSTPHMPLGWVKLAVTLQELDHHIPDGGSRVLEAVTAYSTALELGLPDGIAVSIYGNMGAMLMGAGHHEKAIASLNAGIRLAEDKGMDLSTTGGLLYNRGKAYGYLGEAAQSVNNYRAAIAAARTKDPHIYSLASASLKEVTDDELAELMAAAERLEGNSTDPALAWLDDMTLPDRAYFNFCLYTAHKQRGDLGRAWDHLHRGNALYRKHIGQYNLQGDTQLMQTLMSVFRGKFWGGGHEDNAPIFVVGIPRSGSTLIEQILASHSKVWGGGEDTVLAPIIGEMMARLQNTPELTQSSTAGAFGKRYIQEMRARIPEDPRKERIVDKMLRNLWNIGYIQMMLPNSCIIHAVRHPIDTAISCYEQPFEGRGTPWAWDLEEISEYIMLSHAIANHWDLVLPGRVLRVMYEDLVGNQEKVTRRMLKHCGLDFEEQVLKFHELKRGVQTASVAQVRQRMYSTSVFKHKQVEAYIQPAIKQLAPLARRYEAELKKATQDPSAADNGGRNGKDEL